MIDSFDDLKTSKMNEGNMINVSVNNLNQVAGSMSVVTAVTDLTNEDKGSGGGDINANNNYKMNANS